MILISSWFLNKNVINSTAHNDKGNKVRQPRTNQPLANISPLSNVLCSISISFLLDHHLPTVCFHMFCLQSLNKQTLRHNTSAEIYPCEVGRWSLPFTNPQPPTDPRDLACPLRNPPVGTRELFQHHKLLLVPLPAPGNFRSSKENLQLVETDLWICGWMLQPKIFTIHKYTYIYICVCQWLWRTMGDLW